MEKINEMMTKKSYRNLSVFIYISAFLSFISVLLGSAWFFLFIILMNLVGYRLVCKKYRQNFTLLVKDDTNDMVMLYLCKIGGCYLMAFLLTFFMREDIQTYDEMKIRLLTFMVILFAITPSVKKGVRNIQDKYKYSMINKKNSILLEEEKKRIHPTELDKKSQRRFTSVFTLLKKHYSMVNTILPIFFLMIIYTIPIAGDDYYIYDCMEDFEGVFLAFLFFPITIIIVNWVYKVFQIRLQVLYVINIVLYALVILNFLFFFAKYEFVSFMLVPMLFALFMVFLSKSLIDNVTALNNEIDIDKNDINT